MGASWQSRPVQLRLITPNQCVIERAFAAKPTRRRSRRPRQFWGGDSHGSFALSEVYAQLTVKCGGRSPSNRSSWRRTHPAQWTRSFPMTVRAIFEAIDRRVELDKEDSDSAYFQALTLKLEYLTKLVTAGVLACVGDDADRHRYSQEHTLIRADSVGEWVRALNGALVGPAAQFFLPDSREVVKELTERVGPEDWRHSAVMAMKRAAEAVGSDGPIGPRVALRQLFEIGAQLRNRSRGHGATTTEQQSRSSAQLDTALTTLAENLQLFELPWAYLHQNLSGKYRVSPLSGETSCFDFLKRTTAEQFRDGVYVYLGRPVRVGLVFSGPDLHDIALPNGNYRHDTFEVLSYITSVRLKIE